MRREKTNQKSGTTRRTFLKSTGALAAGLSAAGVSAARGAKVESLALSGGSKAVTYPDTKHRETYRWPRYGAEEEKAILELIRTPSYAPIALLEKEWQEFTGSAHVKSHCNGTSALTSMFFALDLPPGSEIMVPSYTFFATITPMRIWGLVPVFVDIEPFLGDDLAQHERLPEPQVCLGLELGAHLVDRLLLYAQEVLQR